MAYIVMAYIVMAYTVLTYDLYSYAYIVMAYIVMAWSRVLSASSSASERAVGSAETADTAGSRPDGDGSWSDVDRLCSEDDASWSDADGSRSDVDRPTACVGAVHIWVCRRRWHSVEAIDSAVTSSSTAPCIRATRFAPFIMWYARCMT